MATVSMKHVPECIQEWYLHVGGCAPIHSIDIFFTQAEADTIADAVLAHRNQIAAAKREHDAMERA